MKIYLANDSKQGIGGGWSFMRNLKQGLKDKVQIVNTIEDCDIFFISGVTMVQRDTVNRAKALNKKIVVRIDNVPRNSRNRNTGTSRLKEFCNMADKVVWQTKWSRYYLNDFINRRGVVIYNGVDTSIFNQDVKGFDFGDKEDIFLYSRFNRDENKRWEEVWYRFQLLYRENNKRKLILIGQFSPKQIEYNFDFFRGEKVNYFGIVRDQKRMAKFYRSCGYLFAPYYIETFSNTYLEALASGVKLYEPNKSGGTIEMLDLFRKYGISYFSLERMTKDYLYLFNQIK